MDHSLGSQGLDLSMESYITLGVVLGLFAVVVLTTYRCSGGKRNAVKPKVAKPRAASETASKRTFTAEEVAKHTSPDDLWLIIDSKVYDFTDYYMLHPGGEAIMRNAGKDSTKGFSGTQHPARVWDMILDFYIGDLETPATEVAAASIVDKKDA